MTDPCNTATSDDEPGRANAPDWIRRAAIELFRRNGYDATSPRELSEAAGVGVGTLDRHIGSKEELLFEISIGLLRSALAEAEQAIAPIEEPERRLRALAAQLITHRVTHDHAWSVVLREDRALTAIHRAAVTAVRHAYEALWSSVLADGATAGAWRPVDPVDLRGMLGMFLSTGSWLDPHGASSPAEVADRYVDVVLGGIGTTTPAPPLADTDPAGAAAATRKGPLAGLRVVEFAGIGPAPMAAMVLADLGATVLRIDRRVASGLGIERPLEYSYSMRSRHAISLDLKDPEGVETALALIDQADALIEGFRPGVMERLGLGPDEVLARNPRLVYGRVTGWGQTGPLARTAGHDINYLSVTGVLDAIGRPDEPPTVPLNLLGDYAGGALYLVVGLLSGVLEARHSGRGQVVDAAIVDGVANLASVIVGLVEAGQWQPERGTNVLDGGAFYYGVYECADGTWASIGPIEPKFLTELVTRMGIAEQMPAVDDPDRDRLARELLAATFRTRRRDEWIALLGDSDACFTPVLSFAEAYDFAHLRERSTYTEVAGVIQPAPAPRFSRTPPGPPAPVVPDDTDVANALQGWFNPAQIAELLAVGVLRSRDPS